MKTKREIIKEAYNKESWALIGKHVDENGWLNMQHLHDPVFIKDPEYLDIPLLSDNISDDSMKRFVRPKILHGIEDNNGWIKINGKDDMPKKDCLVKICLENKVNSVIHQWYAKDGLLEATQLEVNGYRTAPYRYWIKAVSHYKIYVPEPEPLY